MDDSGVYLVLTRGEAGWEADGRPIKREIAVEVLGDNAAAAYESLPVEQRRPFRIRLK